MGPLASCSLPALVSFLDVYRTRVPIVRPRETISSCRIRRQSADDADRDNNIVTLSLHAQPTHTLLSLPECKLTSSLIASNCAIGESAAFCNQTPSDSVAVPKKKVTIEYLELNLGKI